MKADDPFIAGIRITQAAPTTVRLIIELKQVAIPQVFQLQPVAAYQHRLVVDFYPPKAADPLEALIAEKLKDDKAAALPPLPSAPAVAEAPVPDPLGELIAQQVQRPPRTTTAPAAEVARPRAWPAARPTA